MRLCDVIGRCTTFISKQLEDIGFERIKQVHYNEDYCELTIKADGKFYLYEIKVNYVGEIKNETSS